MRLFSGDCSHPLLPPAVEGSSTHLPGILKHGHNRHIINMLQVMTELDQLFRYTALFLLDELLSPVVTPLVLIFGLSHRTQVSLSTLKYAVDLPRFYWSLLSVNISCPPKISINLLLIQEIVDFFRNFTVDVVGVGDVCSFAQMDVRKHGHPGWQVGRHD